ncbi:hypothetical protein QYF36_015676 [Acer negundo]|nr:hypothetical protein QYF36_015676 [Acer negundo]
MGISATIATLNTVNIVANGLYHPKKPANQGLTLTAIVFASPRVGDSSFKKVFKGYYDLQALCVRNNLDVVPKYLLIGYAEVGQELGIDTTKSKYLKSPGNVPSWHNLEGYWHEVAGYKGVDEVLSWIQKNKGMVQQSDGSWKLMDRDEDDDIDP